MLSRSAKSLLRWWLFFLAGSAPFIYLVWLVLSRGLGPDPGEAITRFNGIWSFNLLLICLAVTPLNRVLGWRWLVGYRRMLGLYAWFYSVLHVTGASLLVLDVSILLQEFVKRPYILVGLTAFVLMTLLAVTSPKVMVRKLGRRWKPLHRSIYLTSILVLVHFIWQIRADFGEPVMYGMALFSLLGIRVYWSRKRRGFTVGTSTNTG